MRAEKSKHGIGYACQHIGLIMQYKQAMRRVILSSIAVRPRPGNRQQGWLVAGPDRIPVALGRGGIRANKREGDGATPRGSFRLMRLWFRADRSVRPATLLPIRPISLSDAWCEQAGDRRYNLPVRLSANQIGDRLWRADNLYDLVIETNHNRRPRIAGRGSAIFIHVARPALTPTAGCIGVPKCRLMILLRRLGAKTRLVVHL